jgi:hypothetical protein
MDACLDLELREILARSGAFDIVAKSVMQVDGRLQPGDGCASQRHMVDGMEEHLSLTFALILVLTVLDVGRLALSAGDHLQQPNYEMSETLARATVVVFWHNVLLGAFYLALAKLASFMRISQRLASIGSRRGLFVAAAAITFCALPFAWLFVSTLNEGRQAIAFISMPGVKVGTALFLAATAAGVTLLWYGKVRALSDLRASWTILFCAVASAFTLFVDASLLQGRYRSIHFALCGVAFVAIAWSIRLVRARWHGTQRRPSRRRVRLFTALVATFVIGLPHLWPQRTRWPLQQMIVKHSAFAGKLNYALNRLRAAKDWRAHAIAIEGATSQMADEKARGPAFSQDREGTDVVLISIDGLNVWDAGLAEMSAPGPVAMPYLRERARHSVFYPRAYTTYPATQGTLLSFLTGTWWHERRDDEKSREAKVLRAFRRRGYVIYCDLPFLSTILEKAQARDLCDVEVHGLRREGEACFGKEHAPECELVYDQASTSDRLNALRDFLVHEDRPVMAWTHLLGTHPPYEDWQGENPPPFADAYRIALAATDRVLATWSQTMRAEAGDAMVIYFADHGHAQGWHGLFGHHTSLYEDQIRVPLIFDTTMFPPKMIDRPLSLIEFSAWLVGDAKGSRMDAELKGEMTQLAMQQEVAGAVPVISHVGAALAYIEDPYKLLVDPENQIIELYDIRQDPQERYPLVDREPKRVRQMLQRLYLYSQQHLSDPGTWSPSHFDLPDGNLEPGDGL